MNDALMRIATLLLVTAGIAAADPKPEEVKTSRTCRYNDGPKKGESQYFADAAAIPIGSVCEDGGGSTGVAVADTRRVIAKAATVKTSRTCKFKEGAKAGQTQHFPGVPPVPIGEACGDGAGSVGIAVADSRQRAAARTSRTCKYKRGSRAGYAQYFPEAPPIELGQACEDGDSAGVAVVDSPSGRNTSRTCKYTTGPRKGESQHFPDIEAVQLGASCEDGASMGVVVPDRRPKKR